MDGWIDEREKGERCWGPSLLSVDAAPSLQHCGVMGVIAALEINSCILSLSDVSNTVNLSVSFPPNLPSA